MLQQAVQSRMERLAFSYGCQHWLLGSFMNRQPHSATALQHGPYSVVAQRPIDSVLTSILWKPGCGYHRSYLLHTLLTRSTMIVDSILQNFSTLYLRMPNTHLYRDICTHLEQQALPKLAPISN